MYLSSKQKKDTNKKYLSIKVPHYSSYEEEHIRYFCVHLGRCEFYDACTVFQL